MVTSPKRENGKRQFPGRATGRQQRRLAGRKDAAGFRKACAAEQGSRDKTWRHAAPRMTGEDPKENGKGALERHAEALESSPDDPDGRQSNGARLKRECQERRCQETRRKTQRTREERGKRARQD